MTTRISKKQKIITALQVMDTMFAEYPLTELEYTNPFQLLVAVVLSAQTTDKQVNKVTASLFAHVQSPRDMLTLWESWLKEYIKTVWLHQAKTVNLVKTAQLLDHKTRDYWWYRPQWAVWSLRDTQQQYADAQALYADRWVYIPDSIDEMLTLPWVGIKTAKVVLYLLYGQKLVAVDTHVHRVMNRLWIVRTTNPNKTSELLEKLIPDEYKDVAHRVLIYFGRYHCTARNPHCSTCPLQAQCPAYKKLSLWSKT